MSTLPYDIPPPRPRPPCRMLNCWDIETKESKQATEDYRIASEKWRKMNSKSRVNYG